MTLVVDASVALKWVLDEPDSPLAQALAQGEEELLMPDFWLNEAMDVLWQQVRKGIFTPDEAREALPFCGHRCRPPSPVIWTCTRSRSTSGWLRITPPYDTLYLAFAIATGARGLVVADARFVTDLRRHPDPALAGLAIPLAEWGQAGERL